MRISDWSSDVCSSDLNQITSLQNEAQSLINQARNLASLPHSSLQQIQQSVQRTQALLTEAQNIAFDVQQVDQAFQTTYGNASISASDQELIAGSRERWQNTVDGLQDARSEERRVGQECVRTVGSRRPP